MCTVRLTVHRRPAEKVWFLVLVRVDLEQGRPAGEGDGSHSVAVTDRW